MTLMDELQAGDLVTFGVPNRKEVLRVRAGKDKSSPWTFESVASMGDALVDGHMVPAEAVVAVLKSTDKRFVGFRSLFADGKVLQTTKEKGLVLRFANYNFETWEQWSLAGESLANCTLSNRQYPDKKLTVSISKVALTAAVTDKIAAVKAAEEQNGFANVHKEELDSLRMDLERTHKIKMEELEAGLAKRLETLLAAERNSTAEWKAKHDAAKEEAEGERVSSSMKDALLAEREVALAEVQAMLKQSQDAVSAERGELKRIQLWYQDTASAEREELKRLQEIALADKEKLRQLSDAVSTEREKYQQMLADVSAERDVLATERESLTQLQDKITAEGQLAEKVQDMMLAASDDLEKRKEEWATAVAAWERDFGKKREELERKRSQLAERETALLKADEDESGELEVYMQRLSESEEECERIRARLAEVERASEVSLLESRDAAAAETARWKEKFVEAEEKANTAAAMLRLSQTESQDLASEVRSLRVRTEALEEDLKAARSTAQMAETKMVKLAGDLTIAKQENVTLQDLVTKAEETIIVERERANKQSDEAHANKLNAEIEKLEEQNGILNKELQMLKEAIVMAEVKAVEAETTARTQAEIRIKQVEDIMCLADRDILQLNQDKEELVVQNGALEAEVRHLSEQDGLHKSQVETLKSDLEAAKAEASTTKLEKESIDKWLAEAQRHLVKQNNDLVILAAEKKAVEEQSAHLREREKTLSKELQDVKTEVQSMKMEKGRISPEEETEPVTQPSPAKANGVHRNSKRSYIDASRLTEGGGPRKLLVSQDNVKPATSASDSQQQVKVLEAAIRDKDIQIRTLEGEVRLLQQQLVNNAGLEFQKATVEKYMRTVQTLQEEKDGESTRNRELVESLLSNIERLEAEKATVAKELEKAHAFALSTSQLSTDDNQRMQRDISELRRQLDDKEKALATIYSSRAPASGSPSPSPQGSVAPSPRPSIVTEPNPKPSKKYRRKASRQNSQTDRVAKDDTDQDEKLLEAAVRENFKLHSSYLPYLRSFGIHATYGIVGAAIGLGFGSQMLCDC